MLVDKCIEYKIPSCIQPTINQETGTIIYNTTVLAKITEVFTNWDTVMKVINIYRDYGLPIDDIALGVASNFGSGAVKFVLDNCNRDKILAMSCNDSHRAGMTFMDLIIAYNSLESLKLCIRYGIPLTNNTHELYIPCRDCHNGESSYCNYRKITTNFISIKRYGLPLTELPKYINNLTDTQHFYINWGSFLERVDYKNLDKVYDVPDIIPENYKHPDDSDNHISDDE